MNQRNEQCYEGPRNKRDADEQNGSHLPTRGKQEREDREENTISSRRDSPEDASHPSKIEASAMHMAQDMQMMKEKMDMMMNAMRRRVSTNLDKPVHRIDSPFSIEVTSFPLPTKFRMPQVETYDGSRDPLDHLESFKTLKHLQGAPNEIMCRAFSTTLKGPARV